MAQITTPLKKVKKLTVQAFLPSVLTLISGLPSAICHLPSAICLLALAVRCGCIDSLNLERNAWLIYSFVDDPKDLAQSLSN